MSAAQSKAFFSKEHLCANAFHWGLRTWPSFYCMLALSFQGVSPIGSDYLDRVFFHFDEIPANHSSTKTLPPVAYWCGPRKLQSSSLIVQSCLTQFSLFEPRERRYCSFSAHEGRNCLVYLLEVCDRKFLFTHYSPWFFQPVSLFSLEDSCFTILWFFFLPYIDTNQPRVSICPPAHHPEALPSLPPHHSPLHCPRALALKALLHASNLHWSSILYMVRHMFQCYSLKSPHPRLLPQSPKFCSCTSVSLLRSYM